MKSREFHKIIKIEHLVKGNGMGYPTSIKIHVKHTVIIRHVSKPENGLLKCKNKHLKQQIPIPNPNVCRNVETDIIITTSEIIECVKQEKLSNIFKQLVENLTH